jgi:stage II sporulation protein E
MCSMSLDLMSVNLFTGEACVYKYGAAPSYVRSGGRVRSVLGQTPAAGTDDVGPDCVRLRLESGSAAVILSDGAARAENVEERLLACEPGALRQLASGILTDAAARGGWEDDMTVLTLSLEKRSGTV